MPTSRSWPYPPLELDLDEIASSGLRRSPGPDTRPPESAVRPPTGNLANTAHPPPESDVRPPAGDLPDTAPPPPTASDVRSDVRLRSRDARCEELADLLANKDFRSALVVAEELLADDPSDLDAREAMLRCQVELESVYVRRMGSLNKVPSVAVSMKEIPSLALDNRSAFILSLVDGVSTLDVILDMSGMPRLEALRVLHELIQHRTLTLS
jgi:hypothetical protein